MFNLIEIAEDYRRWGFSILPVDGYKKSLLCWNRYQEQPMTSFEIGQWFGRAGCEGIAVLAGPVSGNLEIVDIDVKNDLTGRLMKDFGGRLRTQYPHILSKLVIAQTRNAGYHLLYKAPEVDRCMVLARRPTTDAERQVHPNVRMKVLIETRGTGGYGIVYPTPGYQFLQGSLEKVPLLSMDDRTCLLDLARGFNTLPDPEPIRQPSYRSVRGPESPLDDFDLRGDVHEVLTSFGWIYVRTRAERLYYRRPGETDHETSGNFHSGFSRFMVFSTITEFIPKKPYRPSAVFATLACGSDFTLAAKKLMMAGFGIPYKKIWW